VWRTDWRTSSHGTVRAMHTRRAVKIIYRHQIDRCRTGSNKCNGDDTKSAARQSLNYIKNKKMKYGEKWFSIWQIEFLHPAMWHLALKSWQWIHQVATPYNVIRGSGMTCHWICPKVNSISGFDSNHIIAVDMSFCTSLRNFIQIGPPSTEENDVMSIFKMADLSHLGF